MFLAGTAFIAAIGAIFIKGNLDVWLYERCALMQTEAKVLDGNTASSPHAFVVGLDGRGTAPLYLPRGGGTIQIPRLEVCLDAVCPEQFFGIGEEEVGVGLEVDAAAVAEKLTVAFKEISACEALRDLLHLWVREGEPYLTDLVRRKETLDELDVRAKEADVLHAALQGFLGSCPHSCALDVNADEVLVGCLLPKSYGIFASTTAKFQHDRISVMEEVFMPTATQREIFLHVGSHRALHDKRVLRHLSELRKLAFAHNLNTRRDIYIIINNRLNGLNGYTYTIC